jgi:hypothetical protein
MYRYALALGVLGTALWAPAATLQQLTLDQIGASASSVVHARIASASTAFSGAAIYTHYRLQILETLKGAAPAEFVLPGGVSGHYRQSFPGVPELSPGTEYVLFLWTSQRTGLTFPVGLSQGIFDVTAQSDGAILLTRPRIGEMMLDASGRPVADTPPRTMLGALRTRFSAARATQGNGAAK